MLSEVGETSRTQWRELPARAKGRPTISKQGASNLSRLDVWNPIFLRLVLKTLRKNVSNVMLV